jgi:hypothetical protein
MQYPENILKIFSKGLKIYLKNFLSFSRVMLFPVLGQVLGLLLILGLSFLYSYKFLVELSPEIKTKFLIPLIAGAFLIVLPGFVIFLKAFWDYLVVLVSLNTMTAEILNEQKAFNFKEHNKKVNERSKDYITLLFLIILVSLIFLLIPFIFLMFGAISGQKIIGLALFLVSLLICLNIMFIICFVYFGLCYQVFAFEEIKPVKVIQKSVLLVNGNFWRTIFLGGAFFLITSVIIPEIFDFFLLKTPIVRYISPFVETYFTTVFMKSDIILLIQNYGYSLSSIAQLTFIFCLNIVTSSLLMPLGSVFFTILYFDINARRNENK